MALSWLRQTSLAGKVPCQSTASCPAAPGTIPLLHGTPGRREIPEPPLTNQHPTNHLLVM
ncbi:predicted protein [Histoplasma mississippiense (nom. inval.)]|uniref:predicted protein n=1 Tax=Ajellomyces capsulatus (strain NAm1 / WU24) TaxID=2059318 RepID=UPI000157BC49|nr:predicted protein [Histoplasma mississippiense (nom. inval.)]EDN05871.1 predicted protein [Histoplasma mississippiense (nom. inval.)]